MLAVWIVDSDNSSMLGEYFWELIIVYSDPCATSDLRIFCGLKGLGFERQELSGRRLCNFGLGLGVQGLGSNSPPEFRVVLLMVQILQYLNNPKLWELCYVFLILMGNARKK